MRVQVVRPAAIPPQWQSLRRLFRTQTASFSFVYRPLGVLTRQYLRRTARVNRRDNRGPPQNEVGHPHGLGGNRDPIAIQRMAAIACTRLSAEPLLKNLEIDNTAAATQSIASSITQSSALHAGRWGSRDGGDDRAPCPSWYAGARQTVGALAGYPTALWR